MLVGVCEECSEKDDEELIEIAYQGCREIGLTKGKMELEGVEVDRAIEARP